MKLTSSHVALLLISSVNLESVSGQSLKASDGDNPQCIGTLVDLSRLQRLSSDDEDPATFLEQRFGAYGGEDSNNPGLISFSARDIHLVFTQDQSECLGERHRLREIVGGMPVFGADFVVTTNACSEMTLAAAGMDDRSAFLNTNTLATMDLSTIKSIDGYRSKAVNVPTGYSAKFSKDEAFQLIAQRYGIEIDKISELKLEIYLTEDRDYRAWVGTLLVETVPGEPRVYQVVIDDDNGDLILQCEIAGFDASGRQEQIRKRHRRLQASDANKVPTEAIDGSLCTSCAKSSEGITWNYDQVVECDVQTLYLNNTDRKTLCISGTDANGNARVGPGRIPQYHWNGTQTCNGNTFCTFSPVPECADAINDVQFNAIYFFQYLQEHLGIMGGLGKDANNPIPVLGRTHYEWEFCNAFYMPGQHIVNFGDCDCEFWSPLVSTDVVVHEITHGLTFESSALLYFMQPGGLNEAYSDIMGAAVEFTLNDSKDTPDFKIGEALGGKILRDMENPSSDGNSIDDFCAYEGAMRVHFSSGFLNRAYVSSVRNCESTCGTTSECAILMADMFMYTNLESLCMLSDFKDAAKHTVQNVEEFFAARSPTTSCSIEQARTAAIAGFSTAGLSVAGDNFRVSIECKRRNWFVRFAEQCSNFVELLKGLCLF